MYSPALCFTASCGCAGLRSFSSHPNTRSHRTGHSLRDSRATRLFRVVDGFSADFASRTIQDADDVVFITHTALPIALRSMLTLRLTTDVRLIDFDRSKHQPVLPVGEGDTDAMSQVLGGFLTDTEVACQLGAGHPFQVREHQIYSVDPDPTKQG